MKFELTKSYNHMWALEVQDASTEQHWYLHSALMRNHMDDPFYKASRSSHPFFQCGSENTQGYVLIEFWVEPGEEGRKRAQTYIDFLNEKYQENVEEAKKDGTIEWYLDNAKQRH